MDESWRFRPGAGDVCPVCSASHFPFCSQLLPFDRHGFPGGDPRRFHLDARPPFHDFHPALHGGPPPFPGYHLEASPLTQHPYGMSRNVEPWNDLPPPEREFFRQPFPPSERFFHDELLVRENFRKRMRVDSQVIGYPGKSQPPNRLDLLEDERRLNLIRDHGRQAPVLFEGGQGPTGDYYLGGTNLQDHRGSMVANYSSHGPAGSHGPIAPPESPGDHQNSIMRAGSYEVYRDLPTASNAQDFSRLPPQEMKESQKRERDDSNSVLFSSSYGEGRREHYSHLNVPSHPSQGCDYGDGRTQFLKNYMVHRNHEGSYEGEKIWPEESVYNSQAQHQVSHPPLDVVPQNSHEAYDHQQQLHQMGGSNAPIKDQQYPLPNSYQAPLVSNVEIYAHKHHNLVHRLHEHIENKYEFHSQQSEVSPLIEQRAPLQETCRPLKPQNHPTVEQSGGMGDQRGYSPMPSDSNMVAPMGGQVHAAQTLPPLPSRPPPPPPPHPPEPSPSNLQVSSSITTGPLLTSAAPVSSLVSVSLSPAIRPLSDAPVFSQVYFYNGPPMHSSTGFATERSPLIPQLLSKQYLEDGQGFSVKHSSTDKPTVIDASYIFRQPHRATRPDHIVIILRGLPGSGKSYLAKSLRDLEIENGGTAPRIHSIDDYFMTEVEKVEDSDGPKSSSSVKCKKQVMKKVMEYCYEPEMEEVYRSSMLKAFKKTLDDGIFTFIIVDDRNLRVADFAQFWAFAKRSGYEVYLLEATYKDPAGCAARNVHGFSLDDIQNMAGEWEEAPPLYLRLDIQSLFHGDDLSESNIQEVDMDTEDVVYDEGDVSAVQDKISPKGGENTFTDQTPEGNVGERWFSEGEDLTGVKELRKSKWSEDLDDDGDKSYDAKVPPNSLSGLIQAYGRGEKSVRWGDQVEKRGYSIGAAKNESISSLVIGPGAGYNVNSNPLPKEEVTLDVVERSNVNESGKRSVFLEHIRAERESFKVVFDRRRQRIGGLIDADDE